MKYLLDTDIVVDHLRKKSRIKEVIATEKMAISIITYAELLYGAYRSVDPVKSLEIIRNFLTDLIVEIVNLNENIIQTYAKIKAKLDISGQKLDDFDLFIAATSLSSSLTLVTRNLKHFKRITGLSLYKTI